MRCVLLLWLAMWTVCYGQPGTSYPVKMSANHRYLTDAAGNPWLVHGDSPWSMMVNLNTSDASAFLYSRRTNGFNALFVSLVSVTYTGGNADSSTESGIVPFTNSIGGQFDLSALNLNYFVRCSNYVTMAATNGIVMFLYPLETGGFQACALQNGATKCLNYGTFVGNWFKGFTNICWLSGNDYHCDDASAPAWDAVLTNVAWGIKQTATNHLQGIELEVAGGTVDYTADGMEDSRWWPLMDISLAYTYGPTYVAILHEFQRANALPEVLGEGHYEGEVTGGPPDAGVNTENGTPSVLRRQAYWTMTSGGCGQFYGNGVIWPMLFNWQGQLFSTGVKEAAWWNNLFKARKWYQLSPDTNHILAVAGYGTRTLQGKVSTSNYATAALTPDGTLGMIYTPVTHTLSVAMTNFANVVTNRWYDPTANTFTTISGSPFPNTITTNLTSPGNNSAGATDWVLVMESAPSASLATSILGTGTLRVGSGTIRFGQ